MLQGKSRFNLKINPEIYFCMRQNQLSHRSTVKRTKDSRFPDGGNGADYFYGTMRTLLFRRAQSLQNHPCDYKHRAFGWREFYVPKSNVTLVRHLYKLAFIRGYFHREKRFETPPLKPNCRLRFQKEAFIWVSIYILWNMNSWDVCISGERWQITRIKVENQSE